MDTLLRRGLPDPRDKVATGAQGSAGRAHLRKKEPGCLP